MKMCMNLRFFLIVFYVLRKTFVHNFMELFIVHITQIRFAPFNYQGIYRLENVHLKFANLFCTFKEGRFYMIIEASGNL